MQASKLIIKGTVQGVGFRPFVYQIANYLGLNGWVKNITQGVEIVIDTPSSETFLLNLKKSLPRLAKIESIAEQQVDLTNTLNNFLIVSNDGLTLQEISNSTDITQNTCSNYNPLVANDTVIPVDSSVCDECIKDTFNPKTKYYLYPFTSCSHCGPRYTLIKNLPYCRANTALANFPFCSDCNSEFMDSTNRRYYAETTSCNKCGPRLDIDLANVATYIKNGKIVVLKTVGGYVLLTDANNVNSVKRLRELKQRENKPFALMALNTQSIKNYYCLVNAHEESLLTSLAAPVVILKKKHPNVINQEVAPKLNTLGFILPSSPIHYLLFYYLLGCPDGYEWLKSDTPISLIVTSANTSGSSIISDNKEAINMLTKPADIIVGYNRDIVMKCDDSVILPTNNYDIIIRRARGLAPMSYQFDYKLPQVLGLGAHLKNTLCFTRDDKAYLSQYLGDMGSEYTIAYFHNVKKHYENIFGFKPELVISDLHPDFYTTLYANEFGLPHLQLQHHYAHLSAVIANTQSQGKVLQDNILGCTFDGYGFGVDGSHWGGELIQFNYKTLEFKRISNLPVMPSVGGDNAKLASWKLAVAWCLEYNLPIPKHILAEPSSEEVIMLIKNKQFVQTSSAGTLFSLVSALLGICCHNSYEAEAALKLESMVTKPELDLSCIRLTKDAKPDIHQLVKQVYHITYNEHNLTRAINVFYANLATLCEKWIIYHASMTGISQVALAGGCWQSRYLLQLLLKKLKSTNIEVLLPENLPLNDEAISFGQAWYGARYLLSGKPLCV